MKLTIAKSAGYCFGGTGDEAAFALTGEERTKVTFGRIYAQLLFSWC